jgi:eukaryotic-like serine/threonine-protein kinase
MSNPIDREVAVFGAARRLPAGERAAYLDEACAGNAELRLRVEQLLRASDEAGGFLQDPAPGAQRPMDASTPRETMQITSAPGEKPGDRIGRYKLLQPIGEGGCGVVYMAEQEEPVRRRVALKVIKLGMDTKSVVARFEAERQALALMDHPNIAKVLDAGATDTGRPYFVMELVRGIKITQYCDENNLATRERLDLFIQVAQAVQHAHQKGIIHRDLKPSNILVADHDGVPVPKIIDFGIAKATTDQRLTDKTLFTAFEQFIGTPAYMSPEQARMSGLDVDTRTDIYSLGVLLYELLTGKTPFDGEDLLAAGLEEMRRTISEKEPARPSTRLSTMLEGELTTTAKHRHTDAPKLVHLIRGDLDWIVMKALEKDRARRYESANGLAMDIQRHLKNEPVVARPPSNLYRFQKLARRNKLAFAATAAIAIALVTGVAVSTWQAIRATRSEREQSRLRAAAQQAQASEAGLRQTAQTEASRAEAAATDLKMTLSAADFRQAVRLIEEDNAIDALPFLARSLSANPANDAALTRLTTLLTYRSWMRPQLILKHDGEVESAEFSPDGRRIVTVSDDDARVWNAETGQPLTPPLEHQFGIVSAHFSPDGERIVTASLDKTARIWNAQTGQPITEPMKHSAQLSSAEFRPDGKRIVTGSFDNTFVVWDVETGKLLLGPVKPGNVTTGKVVASSSPAVVPLPVQTSNVTTGKVVRPSGKGNVYSVNVVGYANSRDGELEFFDSMPLRARFSPDGKQIVTVSSRTVRIWDAQTGQSLTEPMKHDGADIHADFSPNGEQVVTFSGDFTARVWDARTGQPVTGPLKHDKAILSAEFSLDGKRIVTASEDNRARVWDAQTGQVLDEPIRLSRHVSSTQFSPDGKRIVRASGDTARIWDLRTGRPLTESMKHRNAVRAAHFSPDGKRVVTASADNTVCVWDVQTGRTLVESLRNGGRVDSIQFSPDGKRIVTASRDMTARVWNAQTGQPLTEPMKHGSNVVSAQFSPDGKRIVTASADSTARVWDAETGQPLIEPMKHGKPVRSAEFSPDGQRIVTASEDKTARIWDAQTGRPRTEFLKHGSWLVSAHFSPDGNQMITASGDRTARIWDARTGQALTEPLKLSDFMSSGPIWATLNSAEFSPEGKRFLTASSDYTRVWDAQTGRPLTAPIKHGSAYAGLRVAHFSPDGKRIVTASADSTARVWDAETGQPLIEPMKHDKAVVSAQFSPDGKRIVTASADRTARVWDARSGQPLTDPLIHPWSLHEAQFNPDGTQIVTAVGWVAMVWDVAPAQIECPRWLLTLTEAISGQVLNQQGVLEPTRLNCLETLNQIREQLKQQPGDDDWVAWGRWFFADHATRTISPFSKITVPEYIVNRIEEKTLASLDEAEQLAADKPEVLRRISTARDEYIEDRIKEETSRSLDEAERLAADKPEVLKRISAAREPADRRASGADHARHGEFAEAAADFARAIELRPEHHETWHWQAATLVQGGQLDAYRELRRKSVELFGHTTDPNTAERIAKDYLILPSAELDLETAAKMAETAVSAPTNHPDMTWFQLAKGLAEYRQGRFGSAVEWIQKVLSRQDAVPERDAEAYMVLAMAHYRSGQADEARIALAKGVEIAEKKLPRLDSGDLGDGWLDWIIAHALLREARALIQLPAGKE